MGQTVYTKPLSTDTLKGLSKSFDRFAVWSEGTSDDAIQPQYTPLSVLPGPVDQEELLRSNQLRFTFSTVFGGLMELSATEATANVCVTPIANVYALPIPNLGISPIVGEARDRSIQEADVAANAISREVLKEIETEGIKSQIYASLAIAKKTYSTLHDLKVTVEYDPEIRGHKKFEIHLTVSGDPQTVFKDEMKFKKILQQTIDDKSFNFIALTYAWK